VTMAILSTTCSMTSASSSAESVEVGNLRRGHEGREMEEARWLGGDAPRWNGVKSIVRFYSVISTLHRLYTSNRVFLIVYYLSTSHFHVLKHIQSCCDTADKCSGCCS
jgi:hypothetical protein